MGPSRPIADHALIGDCRGAALVARDGAIDWLCWPCFDSPSVFGALLDEARGGLWRVGLDDAVVGRAYVSGTNVLVTRFERADGAIEVVDLMPVASEAEKRGMLVPEHELVRIVRCVRGAVDVDVTFDPRGDYGDVTPALRPGAFGAWRFTAAGLHHTLRATFPLEPASAGLRARVPMVAGDRHYACLTAEREVGVLPPLGAWTERRFEQTIAWWRGWCAQTRYDGPYRQAVERSALTLKLMCYAPSGAIVAAPTTSLPERPGGDLNWDYRYCWVRDAAFTVRALLGLGHRVEAEAFAAWLLHSTRLSRPEIRVLYDVFGRRPQPERALSHLAGYGGARPIRVGNAAADQLQIDTYGELIDAVARVYGPDRPLDRETSGMLRDVGTFVCRRWEDPDRGIWEIRGDPRAFTHSRTTAWVALDRLLALQASGALRRKLPVARFERNRAWLRAEIEQRAWSPALGAYTQVLDGDTVDASLLLLGWYGFHPPEHERMRGTVARIRERLEVAPGLLYRVEDSAASGEGAFAVCSFWLVEHLATSGRADEADALFRALLARANDVGLYAEEIDPRDGSALGNFPQAYTHVGLISAALALRPRPEGPWTS